MLNIIKEKTFNNFKQIRIYVSIEIYPLSTVMPSTQTILIRIDGPFLLLKRVKNEVPLIEYIHSKWRSRKVGKVSKLSYSLLAPICRWTVVKERWALIPRCTVGKGGHLIWAMIHCGHQSALEL